MNVRLFGLTVDGSGALSTIRSVTAAGVQMAADAGRSAQLYADAYREKLNRVAREYIPATMQAIDQLRERQAQLATSGGGVVGSVTQVNAALQAETINLRDAEQRFEAYMSAQQGAAAATEAVATSTTSATAGLGRIRMGLTSLIAQYTGSIPVLDRVGGSLLTMGAGGTVALGVIAGLALIAAAYHYATREAAALAETQDKATEALKRLQAQQNAGVGGQTAVDVKNARDRLNAMGAALATQDARVAAFDPVSEGHRIASAIADTMRKSYNDQAAIVAFGESHLAELRKKASSDSIAESVRDVAAIIASGDATKAQIRNAELMVVGLNQTITALRGNASKLPELTDAIAMRDALQGALHPRDTAAEHAQTAADREAAKIIRERAEAYTALIDAQDKAQTKRLEGVRGLQDEAASSARLAAAMQQGAIAYQDQTDAEKVLDLVRKAGLKTGDEEYDEAVRNATAIVANDRAVKDLQETQKRADEADKQSARALVEEQKRQAQEVDRVLRSSFSSFFTGVLTQGKDEFQSLWDSVKQGFLRMLSDMLAASATAKLAGIFGGMLVPAVAGAQGGVPALDHNGIPVNVGTMSSGSAAAGYGGAALGGAAVGYGIGQTMYSTSHSEAGNYARGAIGGAAAGAAIGTMLMPGIGTAIGAVAGLIGGILGVGSASRAAAAQMVQAQKDVRDSMDALHAIVANDPLAQGVAQIEADREARRKAIEDAYQGGDATSDQVTKRNAALLEMNTLEDRRIAQLKEETALQSARAQEDLRVRGLRAQGMGSEADDMAFAAQQQREREDMVRSFGDVIDATEATTLALLDQVQAQEKLAHAAEVAIAAAQKEVDAANTRLSAAQTALNTAKQAATTLQEFSRSLTVANASPVDQLAATRQAFDAATAAARGGDQSAAASLPQLAQAFLDASRAFNASSPAYQQDLKSVQGVIDEIAKQYANQASLQQQIVDLLKAQQATSLAALQAAQDAEAKRESDAERAVQQMAFLVAENAGDASGMITAVTALRVDGVSQADALITRLQDLRGTVDDATQRQIDAATFALLENRNAVATAANTEIAAIQAGASVQAIYGLEQIRQAEQARLDANDAAIRQEAALYLQKSAITDQTSAQALAYQAQIDAIELARAQANANALDQIALLQDQVRLMDALSKVGSTDKGGGNVPAGTGGTAARNLVSAASGTADVSRAVARGSEATVASLQATNASLEQTVRVLAAGFTVLQDQLTTLTAEVRDGTAATKRGFEGTRLRAS